MAQCPFATWRNSPNHGGPLVRALGVILHVEQGTEPGTCQVFSEASYKASAHFGVAKSGTVDQFVDTSLQAWAQAAGNSSYFSIETEGYATEPLTAAQVASCARLYGWLQQQPNATFGFRVTDIVGQTGLGWHGMGGAAWGGHLGCPGDLRKAQRQQIVDLARPTTEAQAMARVANPVAAHRRPGAGPEQFAIMAADGAMYAFNGAPYCHAYNEHPEWGGNVRAGVDFEWDADGWGWTQYFDDGAHYSLR